MDGILNTTRIQLASLDVFANQIGYSYNGKHFDNDEGNKVSFQRMVELHNGVLYSLKQLWGYRYGQPIKAGNEYIPLGVIEDARKNNLVKRVKLQQKRNGQIVTQSHIVEAVV